LRAKALAEAPEMISETRLALEHHHHELLPTSAGKKKPQKSGPDRSHEKAPDDP